MLRTPICDTIGIKYPIIQAGMGPGDTTPIAAAASKVGALGIISAGMGIHSGLSPLEEILRCVSIVRAATDNVFGLNLPINLPYTKSVMEALIEARRKDPSLARQLRVVIMSAGDSGPYIKMLKDEGLFTIHVVPSTYHAKRMERLGIDAVVAEGYEGGGHKNPDPVNTFVLVPAVVDAVKIPVIAAGGFCDAKSLVAALVFGAQGIQMGSRFIATKESGFHQNVKELFASDQTTDRSTVITRGTVGPLRYLKNEWTATLIKMVAEGMPEEEILRFKEGDGKWENNPLYRGLALGDVEKGAVAGGQVVGRIHDIPTVQELVERIVKGAEEIIKDLHARYVMS